MTYAASWALVCLIAAGWLVARRRLVALFTRAYWRFLGAPWKLATFALAAAGLIVLGPYTGDPTWDWIDSSFMSALTFATAPWTVAVVWRAARGRASRAEAAAAVVVALFSAGWSYDAYLWWRDGYYPVTWLQNLFASSLLYAAAGLFWNLERAPDGTLLFAFTREPWPPATPAAGFREVAWPALVLMALVAAMVVPLVWLTR